MLAVSARPKRYDIAAIADSVVVLLHGFEQPLIATLSQKFSEHAPGVRVGSAQATYLAWLDFRETGLGDDPAAAVLERGRLSLLRGTEFGAVGAGFARLNIGTSHAIVEESVRRIGRALSRVRGAL